jgi:hypothetical protein
MKSIQWAKDSHGLFDYDMKDVIRQSFKVKDSKVALRCGETIKFEVDDDEIIDKLGD